MPRKIQVVAAAVTALLCGHAAQAQVSMYGQSMVQRPYWQQPVVNPWTTNTYNNPTAQNTYNNPSAQTGQTQVGAAVQLPTATASPSATPDPSVSAAPKGAPLPMAAMIPSSPVSSAPKPGEHLTGIATAIDGGTLSFSGQKIHLLGLESPVVGTVCRSGITTWRCGERATNELSRIAAAGVVHCTVVGSGEAPDSVCTIGRDNVAAAMVLSGMAISDDPELRSRLNEARSDKRGLWVGSDFSWRKGR